MRFGSEGNPWTTTAYVFATGDITPTSGTNAVPTTGTATYSGLSTYAVADNLYFQKGTSTFNVDFGAKTITGTIDPSVYNIGLAGTINGSSFSGTKNGITMQGNFYGPSAAELGGTFNGDTTTAIGLTSFIGAFGAKKQ